MIGLLAGTAAYAVAGFLIAPLAIKLWIESSNVPGPQCRLGVQEVYVNPFTMFLSLRNATLFEQESKLLVSASHVETTIWTVDRLRAASPGRNLTFRNLVVTSAASAGPLLTVPTAIASSVTAGAGGGPVRAAHVRLEQPDAAITYGAAGFGDLPAWLSAPGNDRAGACISLDGWQAVGGRLSWQDEAVSPGVRLELHDIAAEAQRRAGAEATTSFEMQARVGAGGEVRIEALLGGPAGRHPELFSMSARNIALQSLAPYFRRMLGRDIVAGLGDVVLRHERNGAMLRFDNMITFSGLRIDAAHGSTTGDTASLELALALVTDASDRGEISVRGSVADARRQTVVSVFADTLAAHLDQLAATPFAVLADVAGEPDAALDAIAFLPGSAELAPAAPDTLRLLASALGRRPGLGIRVRPGYDLAADRDAIAAQQVRLHIALATSAGARDGRDAAGPDLGDPRVRDVLDEFAGARLSDAQRSAIAGNARDETMTYRDIYRALIANETVSETVLKRLARFRARSVIDTLEGNSVDRGRLRIADALDITATEAPTVLLRAELEARATDHDSATHDRENGDAGR